jgi:SPP1 gp7 family putative phage head morphogenesis protein
MTPAEAARHALEAERRYLAQHRAAQANRRRAARQVDAAAARWGETLGWYSVRDSRTTWDCLRLHGKNFHTADPPNGFLPGAVHPRCRCTPGPPWPNARSIGRTGV